MGPAPLTYATAKYRGVRSKTRPPFDPREPIECAGVHLTAEFAADIAPLHDRLCDVQCWQPRCQDCLDDAPPFGFFRCIGCGHEHEEEHVAPDLPHGQGLCVACATERTLADDRFWITRPGELTEGRCRLPMYLDFSVALRRGVRLIESWPFDLTDGRVGVPSTTSPLRSPESLLTVPFGSLCELAHRRAAEMLRRWPRVGWALTAITPHWIYWSLVREASEVETLAAACTAAVGDLRRRGPGPVPRRC